MVQSYSPQQKSFRFSDAFKSCPENLVGLFTRGEGRVPKSASSEADSTICVAAVGRSSVPFTTSAQLTANYGRETFGFGPVILPGEVADDLDLERQSAGTVPQTVTSEVLRSPTKSRIGEMPVVLSEPLFVFVMMTIFWAGLTTLIGLETRRRGKLLRQIRATLDAETGLQSATLRLLQSLPVPVLLTGSRGVVYANQPARTLASVPGHSSLEKLAEALRLQFDPVEANGLVTRDFAYLRGDGSLRQLSVSASEVQLTGGLHRVYIIIDNTLLRDAELRAMTSGKLAVLGELSSAVAHELNQPLAVIKAAAANGKMLANSFELSQPVIDKFDRIDMQIDRARRIIGNVRKLGQPRPLAPAPFHITSSLNSTLSLVSEQFRFAGIQLEIDIEVCDALTILGDHTLFEIAVLNVLLNAKDAFDDNSRPSPKVRVKGRVHESMVHIEILDNAGGIQPDLLPIVFDSFVSTKSADKGTGLGLSIARRAIEDMDGRIAAENVGEGALFTILLPATLREAAS